MCMIVGRHGLHSISTRCSSQYYHHRPQSKRPFPSEPPTLLAWMERKQLPEFGKRTTQVAELDAREAEGGAAIV